MKESNVVRMCDHKCTQGKTHDCPMPIEEYPPAKCSQCCHCCGCRTFCSSLLHLGQIMIPSELESTVIWGVIVCVAVTLAVLLSCLLFHFLAQAMQ